MLKLIGKFIDNIFEQEIPSGVVDGINLVYTLSTTPHSNKAVKIYLNGLMMIQGTHYTVSGSTITFAGAPQLGQIVYADYIKRN